MSDFDVLLDHTADLLRYQATPKAKLRDWTDLNATYQDVWRSVAMREMPRLLLGRALLEYDADTTRSPSFVTMGMIRTLLERLS